MKLRLLILLVAAGLFGCSGSNQSGENGSESADTTAANQVLYDQVMGIHDEVMPKMNDIEALKRKLKDRIANTPAMVTEERLKLEERIASLDSVGQLMMDWMHKWNMPADSLGEEVRREYLERELERIRQVREAMLGIIATEQDTVKN